MWKKKSKKNEGSLPIKDLQRSSGDNEVTVRGQGLVIHFVFLMTQLN